nr:redoxin domain-containing protein [Wenzhouxiangella sp. XN79A]
MDRNAGADRVGASAPTLEFDAWMNTDPLSLEPLRGRVLLVRWWTGTCPFCAGSAPAPSALHGQCSSQGLTVIGVFQPEGRPRRSARPAAGAASRGATGVGVSDRGRPATSVSFLVDAQGVIRFMHPGMEYHDESGARDHAMCVDDMRAIRGEIDRLPGGRQPIASPR